MGEITTDSRGPAPSERAEVRNHANLMWSIAELLRGDYKRADYGKVILPLVVMRRLDQVLEDRRDAVIARAAELGAHGVQSPERALLSVAGQSFFNTQKLRFHQLLDDPGNIANHLRQYIDGFSGLARDAIDKFDFDRQIDRLDRSNLLFQAIGRICDVNLHPDRVPNHEMGAIFEELIRKFAEQSNETAGEHFTPREVVRLMVNLLLAGEQAELAAPGQIREVFDCACGTGGMLSEAEEQSDAVAGVSRGTSASSTGESTRRPARTDLRELRTGRARPPESRGSLGPGTRDGR